MGESDKRHCSCRLVGTREPCRLRSSANRVARTRRDAESDSNSVRIARSVAVARLLCNPRSNCNTGLHERERCPDDRPKVWAAIRVHERHRQFATAAANDDHHRRYWSPRSICQLRLQPDPLGRQHPRHIFSASISRSVPKRRVSANWNCD
jgi:hypothetical protein